MKLERAVFIARVGDMAHARSIIVQIMQDDLNVVADPHAAPGATVAPSAAASLGKDTS